MRKDFPFYKQLDQMDCGPTCLKMITAHYGKNIDREYLRESAFLTKEGVSMGGISQAAEAIGFQSLALHATYGMLVEDINLPCIAFWRERHFVVVYKIDKKNVYIADPAFGLIKYNKSEFIKGWLSQTDQQKQDAEGVILVLEPTVDFDKTEETKEKKSSFRFLTPFIKASHSSLVNSITGVLLLV